MVTYPAGRIVFVSILGPGLVLILELNLVLNLVPKIRLNSNLGFTNRNQYQWF